MTPWADQVSDWLSGVLDASAFEALAGQLDALEENAAPVVTLFGSYDTGKSAILRRILADEGHPVPEWLTISGRHETFEANEINVAGCTVRDTPGLVVGGSGDRAQAHNTASSDATALTDAMLVVLTPQLATAELPAVQAILDRGWTSEAVAFAINRFDEAGISPTDDPDGYADLAQRKIGELREAIPSGAVHEVFVVASDPFALQGPARDVDPSEWDPFRPWDGMDRLVAWFKSRPVRAAQLRKGAATRFWGESLDLALQDLDAAESGLLSTKRESEAAGQRLALFGERLAALDRAVMQDLQGGLLAITLGADRRAAVNEEWLQEQMDRTIKNWFATSMGRLRDLNDELVTEFETQSARPVIRQLRLLPPPVEERRQLVPDRSLVERLAGTALQAWGTFERSQEAASAKTKRPARLTSGSAQAATTLSKKTGAGSISSGRTAPMPMPDSPSRGLQAATALAPLVCELTGMLHDLEADRTRAETDRRRREALRSEVTRITSEVAEANAGEWSRTVASQRQAAQDAWGPLIAQGAVADGQLRVVRSQLERGRQLASQQTI